jgi:hypothetical protein
MMSLGFLSLQFANTAFSKATSSGMGLAAVAIALYSALSTAYLAASNALYSSWRVLSHTLNLMSL